MLCVCVFICIHTHMCVYSYTRTHMCAFIYTHAHMRVILAHANCGRLLSHTHTLRLRPPGLHIIIACHVLGSALNDFLLECLYAPASFPRQGFSPLFEIEEGGGGGGEKFNHRSGMSRNTIVARCPFLIASA